MKFIVFCVKGLEQICEQELRLFFPNIQILEARTKVIIFDYSGDLNLFKKIKMADDICVYIENKLKFDEPLLQVGISKIAKIRLIKNYFSVTSNIVGEKYQTNDVLESIREQISKSMKYEYKEKLRDNLDFRVFIDDDYVLFGIRLFEKPLSDRGYKIKELAGSLKPTIAYAMLLPLWISQNINLKLVDNFCGSGTILCEGLSLTNEIYGGDINPASVNATKVNLKGLGYGNIDKIKIQDAQKTNWPARHFDCAVSNLPWDKQIKTNRIHELYENTIKEYARILKPNGTIVILAVKSEIGIKMIKKYFPNYKIQTYELGFLGQKPVMVVASSSSLG